VLDQTSLPKTQRNLQLDVLRAVAIVMVLVCHTVYLRQPTWDVILWRPGWSGVDLFFVISGFLISGLLFSEYRRARTIRFSRFFIRRAFKIYPAFYVVVLLTVLLQMTFRSGHWPSLWVPLLNDVLFLQSYREGTWGHFWSLSVEEHFYLLLPAMLWVMMRLRKGAANPFQRLPVVFLLVAVSMLTARLLTAHFVRPFQWQTHLFPTHLRLDSLFFGVIVAYYFHFQRDRFSALVTNNLKKITCVGCILLSPLFFVGQYDEWMYTYGFTSLYLGYGCLMVAFLHVDVCPASGSWNVFLRALAYVGTFSYSIYLWHVPWLSFIRLLPLEDAAVRLAWFYVGSIALGVLAGKAIELPTLRIRDALFPRLTPADVAPRQAQAFASEAIPNAGSVMIAKANQSNI